MPGKRPYHRPERDLDLKLLLAQEIRKLPPEQPKPWAQDKRIIISKEE